MAEGIVDVLEQIEVDAQHRNALMRGLAALERLAKSVLKKIPVRQVGQAIMMGHVGDPGLRLAPFGDVDNGDQIAVAAVECDPPSEGQHMDFAAVGLEMAPVAAGVIDIADLLQRLAVGRPFVFGPDLPAVSFAGTPRGCSRNAARPRH